MKGGNGLFKQALAKILSTEMPVILVFKFLLMQNLRAFLRREETNKEKKATVTLMLTNMYRLVDSSFYPFSARQVAAEFCGNKEQRYLGLMSLLDGIDWNRKRFAPLAREVVSKVEAIF
jgi:hypothetical protein